VVHQSDSGGFSKFVEGWCQPYDKTPLDSVSLVGRDGIFISVAGVSQSAA
jgi:hypothetical protein